MNNISLNVLVCTRFGVGVRDKLWLENRLELFESVTLPSISSQTSRDFLWHIFVGESPYPWVVDRIKYLLDKEGLAYYIHYSPQRNSICLDVINSDCPNLQLFIDDDDAWNPNFVKFSINNAIQNLEKGIDRAAWSWVKGVEFLPCELVDVDKSLKKGTKVNVPPFVRAFDKPFLTMSICVLTEAGYLTPKINSLHHKKCKNLLEDGFFVDEISSDGYMWLYFRHPQADSSILKSKSGREITLDVPNYFKFNRERFLVYLQKLPSVALAKKRTHKLEDKTNILYESSEEFFIKID